MLKHVTLYKLLIICVSRKLCVIQNMDHIKDYIPGYVISQQNINMFIICVTICSVTLTTTTVTSLVKWNKNRKKYPRNWSKLIKEERYTFM